MSSEPKKKSTSDCLATGIGIGVMFGIIFDNLGLWVPIGLCLGLGLNEWMKRKRRKNKDSNHNEQDNG